MTDADEPFTIPIGHALDPKVSQAMRDLLEKNAIANRQARDYEIVSDYLATGWDFPFALEAWEPSFGERMWPN